MVSQPAQLLPLCCSVMAGYECHCHGATLHPSRRVLCQCGCQTFRLLTHGLRDRMRCTQHWSLYQWRTRRSGSALPGCCRHWSAPTRTFLRNTCGTRPMFKGIFRFLLQVLFWSPSGYDNNVLTEVIPGIREKGNFATTKSNGARNMNIWTNWGETNRKWLSVT